MLKLNFSGQTSQEWRTRSFSYSELLTYTPILTKFLLTPKAGLCYYSGGDSVVLIGEVEVIDDAESKEKYWQNWFIKFFPQGVKDPEYILLKFRSNQATIYIDDQFQRVTIE